MKINRRQLRKIIWETVQSITQTPSGAYTGDQAVGSTSDLLQSIEAEIQSTTSQINSLNATDPQQAQKKKALDIKLSDLRNREAALASQT